MRTKSVIVGVASLALIAAALLLKAADRPASDDGPQFTADGQLLFPKNYRQWVYLSSGLGMTYGPAAEALRDRNPAFDNVFVIPAAYRAFMATGKWPDKSMLVLEIRASESKGSINNGGRFQSGVEAVEVEVKDEQRFPKKWAFYGFGASAGPAKMIPASASCYACHATNGAVDNTFVQFYPTLLEVAKSKGTLKASAEQPAPSEARVVDVVCKTPVDLKQAEKLEYKGKTYYFCSRDCRDRFQASPATYLSKANGA